MSRQKSLMVLSIVLLICIFMLDVISEISDPKPSHLISCFLLPFVIICWIASLKKVK